MRICFVVNYTFMFGMFNVLTFTSFFPRLFIRLLSVQRNQTSSPTSTGLLIIWLASILRETSYFVIFVPIRIFLYRLFFEVYFLVIYLLTLVLNFMERFYLKMILSGPRIFPAVATRRSLYWRSGHDSFC